LSDGMPLGSAVGVAQRWIAGGGDHHSTYTVATVAPVELGDRRRPRTRFVGLTAGATPPLHRSVSSGRSVSPVRQRRRGETALDRAKRWRAMR
jgi:hypothetical protein